MRALAIGFVIALLASLATASIAHAQAEAPEAGAASPANPGVEDDNYHALVKEALAEYQLGHWDEALALFQRAHAINPSARTLTGMGKVAFENRQYLLAIDYLKQALQETHHPVTAKQRVELTDIVRRSESFVVHFTVQLEPSDAKLQVDATPAVLSPQGELLMDPGQHELVASAPGHENVVRQVRAVSGASEQLAISLPMSSSAELHDKALTVTPTQDFPGSSEPSVPAQDNASSADQRSSRASTAHLLTLIGVIVGGTGLAVGLTTGIWAMSENGTLKDNCPKDVCQPASRSTLSTARTAATVSTIGFSVAAAGLALAIVGLVMAPSSASSETAANDRAPASPSPSLALRGTSIAVLF